MLISSLISFNSSLQIPIRSLWCQQHSIIRCQVIFPNIQAVSISLDKSFSFFQSFDEQILIVDIMRNVIFLGFKNCYVLFLFGDTIVLIKFLFIARILLVGFNGDISFTRSVMTFTWVIITN